MLFTWEIKDYAGVVCKWSIDALDPFKVLG